MKSLWKIAPVLFITHSAGYFLGGMLCYWMIDFGEPALSTLGKLGWGLLHGLGMGLGIGYAFRAAQSDARR